MKNPRSASATLSVALALWQTLSAQSDTGSTTSSDVSGVVAEAGAESAPAPEPEPGTLDRFFNGELPDAIGKSKINVNVRLRYEHADQEGLEDSNAYTLRTRFGLTTATLYGFQGMIEGEDITVLGDLDNAQYPGQPVNGKTGVADPPTTEINQVWLSYTYTNWPSSAKGGRQRIVLDNARFIGDVGWRQNQQTFDAVSLSATPVADLELFYGWLGRVNRIFGNVPGLPPGQADFQSDSHLIHASYAAWDYAKITGYTYLLDLENGGGNDQSCATYGLSVIGKIKASETITVDYRGEGAWQTDYAHSTLNYQAPYYHVQAGASVKPVGLGVGYEVLGSDGGVASFRTPLATGHAFNGWADVFLTTPAAGLRDLYGYAQVEIPGVKMPLRAVYHTYEADWGGGDFGSEINVLLKKQLGEHWLALAKYAHYFGKDPVNTLSANTDVDKFWLELNFIF